MAGGLDFTTLGGAFGTMKTRNQYFIGSGGISALRPVSSCAVAGSNGDVGARVAGNFTHYGAIRAA